MDFNSDPESRVDKKKAARIIKWLIREEAENNKTNKRDDSEMIRMIAKHIQEEVKCL
jgi:hypothetical protein